MRSCVCNSIYIRANEFFRIRLLSLTNEEIVDLINRFDKETKALKKLLLKMSWYMRGGVNYDDMFMTSFADRELIGKLIEENIETTKESGLPFF